MKLHSVAPAELRFAKSVRLYRFHNPDSKHVAVFDPLTLVARAALSSHWPVQHGILLTAETLQAGESKKGTFRKLGVTLWHAYDGARAARLLARVSYRPQCRVAVNEEAIGQKRAGGGKGRCLWGKGGHYG